MKFGVVVFPGTWSDRDCGWVIDQVLGAELTYLWHKDADLKGCDCVILPGGFAYGDYLRTGAIARFAPVMEQIGEFADRGGLVWGICNGFQVLCEAGLLPGALIRNASLEFRCEWTNLVVELRRSRNAFPARATRSGRVPILRCHWARRAWRQSERIAAQHRGHRQRARQRARHDAAPGAML